MEPLGRIELPTFPLPMGCYTPKPQWRQESQHNEVLITMDCTLQEILQQTQN